MNGESTEDRIVRLETKLAYQDRLLATLDDVVREFANRVELLERQIGLLRGSLSRPHETGPADDRPPHY